MHDINPPPAALSGFRFQYQMSAENAHVVYPHWNSIRVPAHLEQHNEFLRASVIPALRRHLYRWKKPGQRQDLIELHSMNENFRKERAPCNPNDETTSGLNFPQSIPTTPHGGCGGVKGSARGA